MKIKSLLKRSAAVVVAGVVLTGVAPSAFAGGFLADTFIRPLSPQAADMADGIHRDIGKPLDSVPMTIMNQTPIGQHLGNRCATPIGVSGPGPVLPLGTPCNFAGWMGNVIQ